jgi:predicted enzyme related to lactoylglutathione lyase
MGQPVVHWEITGKNGTQLQEFYAQLFDWQIDADNPYQYGLVDTQSDQGINGGIATANEPNSRVTIYVQVADLQATLDKAESLGGKTLMPPMEIPGAVTMALFSDPDGNVTGLIKG